MVAVECTPGTDICLLLNNMLELYTCTNLDLRSVMGKVLGKSRGADKTSTAEGTPVPGSVYVDDDKMKATFKMYQYGRTHGKLPINRGKVLFLGDARQGKTSLNKRLTGEPFNPNQEKTEGIQAKMVETKDIDHHWRSPDQRFESEYERRAAWYTANMATGQNQTREADKKMPSPLAVALDVLFFCFLPLAEFFALFLMVNLGYAYCVAALIAFMACVTDLMSATRTGTGMAVALAFRSSLIPPLTLTTALQDLVSDVGALSWSWFVSKLGTDIDMVTSNALFTVGLSAGIITYQYWGFLSRRLPIRLRFSGQTCLSLFVASISLSSSSSTTEPALMLYCGFCAAFGVCHGLVTGRVWAAMVPVRYLYLKCCGEVLGGALLSLGFGHVVGWQLATVDSISYFAAFTAMVLLLIESYRYYQYYLSIPVTLIDESMREKEKGAQSFPTNLTLMDFAGDEEYYSMHHIFLAQEAVYLLVFSMAEAVRNQNRTLDRLLFWLHSVRTHASSEDCAAFLVGTHRDSVTSLQRQEIATFLAEHLYNSTGFSSLLVLNADHTPLFPVENSKPVDEDMICLRDAIWTMTQQANYARRQLPIRWLKFLEVVKQIEKPIVSLDDLRQECSHIDLEDEDEFHDVLTTFDQAGDIIYQANDETLRRYVVLDPQLLVDAMAKITCPQPTHFGMPKYVEHSTLLEKKGIVRADFIHNAVAQLNIDQPSILLKLLVAYDMLCPLGEDTSGEPGHTAYLVPSRLPEYNPKLHRRLSERHDDDQVFYIDFETFKPDVVYTRVVARCLALCKVEERTHTRTHVFRNVGCFNMNNRFWFTVESLRPAPDQNVLKITVTSATGSNPFDLLGTLHNILEAIRRRDFPNMSYTSGVCCPFEAPHSEYSEPERIHVLKLAGSGETFPKESHPLMFLCCGREHQVVRSIVRTLAQRNGVLRTAGSRQPRPETPLQFCHIQQLSLLLDPPRVLGNDWQGLADHLGYGVTEILNFRRKESPTMALLLDYGTKARDVFRQLPVLVSECTYSIGMFARHLPVLDTTNDVTTSLCQHQVDKVEAARTITEGLELLGRLDAVAVMAANVNRSQSHDGDK
ncbi:hypothetical protein Bbelb_101980 [Branchiostoma belcheri]|nr:hypothetical protein Bbelb_101980 [Branchiostoma belcheri]